MGPPRAGGDEQAAAGAELGRAGRLSEGLPREPYTAGNWHQMLPDLPHPPGSWKHLFV